jgi:hypothetical protein
MGLLAAVAALATLAGCYAPSLRDCTVSCESPTDCATGQVCGDDGLCAAPERAGRCMGMGMPDAAPPDDAAVGDAAPDAAVTVSLHVQVEGKGNIVVDGYGTCSSRDPQKGNCTYEVAPGALLRLRAVVTDATQLFAGWTSTTCSGAGPICAFTPTAPTTVSGRFDHHGLTL